MEPKNMVPKDIPPGDLKELREYAWKYFDRHAEQRLKTFNFYIVLCGAIIAGICAVLREKESQWIAVTLAGIVLPIVTLAFWKLDSRTRDLTKHSEEALKAIEDRMDLPNDSNGAPHRCKLFRREEYERQKCQPNEWSYTGCFRLLFSLFGLGGLVLAVILFSRLPISSRTVMSPTPEPDRTNSASAPIPVAQ